MKSNLPEIRQEERGPLNVREKFIRAATQGKILANKCTKCGHSMLETVYFCEKCGSNSFLVNELEGVGKVVTYTIQAVAPEGFDDVGSYAWVVFKLDNVPITASGFLNNIKSSQDLPIGTKVRVSGFDPKHGLILQKA